jgi:hypothetical protein
VYGDRSLINKQLFSIIFFVRCKKNMVSCENIHLDFSLTVVTNELLVLGI